MNDGSDSSKIRKQIRMSRLQVTIFHPEKLHDAIFNLSYQTFMEIGRSISEKMRRQQLERKTSMVMLLTSHLYIFLNDRSKNMREIAIIKS